MQQIFQEIVVTVIARFCTSFKLQVTIEEIPPSYRELCKHPFTSLANNPFGTYKRYLPAQTLLILLVLLYNYYDILSFYFVLLLY